MAYTPPPPKVGPLPVKMNISARPADGSPLPYDKTQIVMMKLNASNTASCMVDAYARLLAANAAINPLKETEIKIKLDSYREWTYKQAIKELGIADV